MKISTLGWVLSLLVAGSAFGQSLMREDSEYQIKSRGPHHRVWERIEYEDSPAGKVPKVRQYTELTSGMHYPGPSGEWLESREEIEILPNGAGAAATKGPHKVIFPADIYDGQIELHTADNKWLRSRVMGLSFFDVATGESVLIAETTNSIGVVHGDNVIVYPDAFSGDCVADVRYIYRKGGMEQDVILRTAPPDPSVYGLNGETTVMQVLTEFFSPPEPIVRRQDFRWDSGASHPDEHLDFGSISIGRGRAFSTGAEQRIQEGIRVQKQWLQIEGRKWLIEQVPLKSVGNKLRELPSRQEARNSNGAAIRTASKQRVLPMSRVVAAGNTNEVKMAMAPLSKTGFVMDYIALSSITNFTFQGDTTYYVNGQVNLSGDVVLEGNTVIKFNPDVYGWINVVGSSIDCKTAEYRPAVFTSKHDNSVGETISGSTNSPSVATDQNFYLMTSDADQELQHLRMLYCYCGLTIENGNSRVSHVQFSHAQYPIYTVDSPMTEVFNVLLHDVTEVAVWTWNGHVDLQHATVNQCKSLLVNEWNASFAFTNSLFVNVTNWGASFTGAHNATNTGSGIFQTVHGGSNYLAAGSVHRNAGTTNIDSMLLAELKTKTTYPPISYTNITFATPQSFSPQAQRDTDLPDKGYHYDPLDYLFGGCHVNSNITFTAGTAVGWFRTSSGWNHAGHGIHLADYQSASFSGTVTAPAYWVRCNTVQEEDRTAGYGPGGISGWAATPTTAPYVRGAFMRSSMMAGDGNHFRDDNGYIMIHIRNSEFYAGALGGYVSQHHFTNCLMDRTSLGIAGGGSYAEGERVFRNCTFRGGFFQLYRWSPGYQLVSVRDCAFDGTVFDFAYDFIPTNPTYNDYNYNAYTNSSNPLPVGGANDVTGVNFNWQQGRWGRFYLPSDSSLIDVGSVTSDLRGLYHFTTRTTQVKETNSPVDIGYHYVATNGSGNPLDSDGDGVPDYLEDVNGNGNVNSGETDPSNSSDFGLKVFITRPSRSGF